MECPARLRAVAARLKVEVARCRGSDGAPGPWRWIALPPKAAATELGVPPTLAHALPYVRSLQREFTGILARAAAAAAGGAPAARSADDFEMMSVNSDDPSREASTFADAGTIEALAASGVLLRRAIDIALGSAGSPQPTNVFLPIRPPGHHAGNFGALREGTSMGFCFANTAVMAAV
jgi:acetoin utilization deacetylase AcuC-like enzyme